MGFARKKTALTPAAANGETPQREEDMETSPKSLRAGDDEEKNPDFALIACQAK